MPPIRLFARNTHVKIKESEITIEFSMSYLALSVPRTELAIIHRNKFNHILIMVYISVLCDAIKNLNEIQCNEK